MSNPFGLKGKDGRPLDLSQVPNIVSHLGSSNRWDMTHVDALDKEMIVLDVQPKRHMSKDCAIATVIFDDERKLCLFASTVLAKQLLEVADQMPVKVKVARNGKRYLFTL